MLNRIKYFFRVSLRKEMTLLVIVKLSFIMLLWYLCFSHPVQSHLAASDLAKHWFQ